MLLNLKTMEFEYSESLKVSEYLDEILRKIVMQRLHEIVTFLKTSRNKEK